MDKLIKELREIANELGCEPHNEEILQSISDLKEKNDSLRTALMKDKEFIEEIVISLDEYKKLFTTMSEQEEQISAMKIMRKFKE